MNKLIKAIGIGSIIAGLSLSVVSPAFAASYKSESANTIEEIHEYFPESYWPGLETLLSNHKNWKFVAFYTGLSWNECFEYEAECYPTRNLAYCGYNGDYYPSS